MQKKQIIALACGLLITGAATAATNNAGNTAGSYTLGVGADYYDFGSAKHLDNIFGAPFVLFGYNFTPEWGVRGAITRLRAKSNDGDHDYVNGWLYNVDAVYRFNTIPSLNLQPYALAGAGILSTEEPGHGRRAPLNVDAGVGMQYFFASAMAIDMSIKDVYTFSRSSSDIVLGLGFDFNFGGSNTFSTASNSNFTLPPVGGQPDAVQAQPAVVDNAIAHFDLNSAKVRAADKANIQALADKVKAEKATHVNLSGYADDTGTADYNMFLSQKRADSVKYYLTRDGVPADEISAKGYGNVDKAANPSEQTRSANRRVDAVTE